MPGSHLRAVVVAGFRDTDDLDQVRIQEGILGVAGAAGAGISIFASGYFRKGEGTPPGLLCLQYHVFVASMAMVVLADDAYAFMVMWETMALSSFFLVTANHRIPEVRSAGYLYITMAHIGAIAILLCFGVLQANTGDYTFDNMRAQRLEPFWASVGFLLAALGFGAKDACVSGKTFVTRRSQAAGATARRGGPPSARLSQRGQRLFSGASILTGPRMRWPGVSA